MVMRSPRQPRSKKMDKSPLGFELPQIVLSAQSGAVQFAGGFFYDIRMDDSVYYRDTRFNIRK